MAETPTTKRNDPLTAFCFNVALDLSGVKAEAYFKSVSGLKAEIEVVDYKEGGNNASSLRLVGPAKWPNLVLSRGFTGDTALIEWFNGWVTGSSVSKRGSGVITALDSKLAEICSWRFKDGWPCKWEGPDFDASKQELAMEKLEIAHTGLVFEKKKG